jgi:N-acetylglucosaminyldiphosphoundecaprenol N-acetyl-beta-D-mannosaminyltransferase
MTAANGDHGRPFGDGDQQAAVTIQQRATVAGLQFDRLDEAGAVEHIIRAAGLGQGGWVVTPNIDICRAARRDPARRALVAGASLVVPDGMPVLWAAKLRGDPLPERVAGSALIFSLSESAAKHGLSIYLLGGAAGVPEQAGVELGRRYPGLVIAGADAPVVGFDATSEGVEAVRARLLAASPDIVFVGLGFPKQERLIACLAPSLPATWFIACGAAIPFAAGAVRRAPVWAQKVGMEWAFRLLMEPRRLFRRYLVNDLPFAVMLLTTSAAQRLRRPPRPSRRPSDQEPRRQRDNAVRLRDLGPVTRRRAGRRVYRLAMRPWRTCTERH